MLTNEIPKAPQISLHIRDHKSVLRAHPETGHHVLGKLHTKPPVILLLGPVEVQIQLPTVEV